MSKTFSKPTKPASTPPTDSAIDAFVSGGAGNDTDTQKHRKPLTQKAVKPARLTIDLDPDDQLRFKMACTANRVKMVDEVRAFIQQRTAELEDAAGIARKAG